MSHRRLSATVSIGLVSKLLVLLSLAWHGRDSTTKPNNILCRVWQIQPSEPKSAVDPEIGTIHPSPGGRKEWKFGNMCVIRQWYVLIGYFQGRSFVDFGYYRQQRSQIISKIKLYLFLNPHTLSLHRNIHTLTRPLKDLLRCHAAIKTNGNTA